MASVASASGGRGPSPSPASARWEASSAAADGELLEAARLRWTALQPARQMGLAQCLADCRRADLTRHFRQVVSVVAGLKRRVHANGDEHLYNEACVVLFVRHKLTRKALARAPAQMLPSELLTPAWIDGREQVVAVPTDVQVERRLVTARAHGMGEAWSESGPGRCALGAMAWCLQVGSKAYALAPIHVLSPQPAADGVGRRAGAEVRAVGLGQTPSGPVVARASGFGGRLTPGEDSSFDVQLAEIRDRQALAAMLGGRRLSGSRPWVRSEDELNELMSDGRLLHIHVAANHPERQGREPALPLLATRSLVEHSLYMEYLFEGLGPALVQHRVLELAVLSDEPTLSGDSGSPVLFQNMEDFPTFVGMLIGGTPESKTSYIIPAWRLLDPGSYSRLGGQLPPGALSLVVKP